MPIISIIENTDPDVMSVALMAPEGATDSYPNLTRRLIALEDDEEFEKFAGELLNCDVDLHLIVEALSAAISKRLSAVAESSCSFLADTSDIKISTFYLSEHEYLRVRPLLSQLMDEKFLLQVFRVVDTMAKEKDSEEKLAEIVGEAINGMESTNRRVTRKKI